jgi:hypothetical protein
MQSKCVLYFGALGKANTREKNEMKRFRPCTVINLAILMLIIEMDGMIVLEMDGMIDCLAFIATLNNFSVTCIW